MFRFGINGVYLCICLSTNVDIFTKPCNQKIQNIYKYLRRYHAVDLLWVFFFMIEQWLSLVFLLGDFA